MTKRDLHENWNESKTVTLTHGVCHLLRGWIQEKIDRMEGINKVFKEFDEMFPDNEKNTYSRKLSRENIRYLKAIKKALE
jgi:hypothetical protein